MSNNQSESNCQFCRPIYGSTCKGVCLRECQTRVFEMVSPFENAIAFELRIRFNIYYAEDIREITQQAYLKVFEKIAKSPDPLYEIEKIVYPRSFFVRIAVNIVYDQIKWKKVRDRNKGKELED